MEEPNHETSIALAFIELEVLPRFWHTIALTLVASVGTNAGLRGQEFVVSQRVVSDTAVDGSMSDHSCANCGNSYVGDLSESDARLVSGSGAGGMRRGFGRPDLFYNYYTQGNSNTTNAQMYLSPMPVPANVGHTFYTYQPFHPHHMLYAHKDRYHKYYDNGRGMNRTRATYSYPPIRTAWSNFYWNKLRLAR